MRRLLLTEKSKRGYLKCLGARSPEPIIYSRRGRIGSAKKRIYASGFAREASNLKPSLDIPDRSCRIIGTLLLWRFPSRGSDPGRTAACHLDSHFAAGVPPDPSNSYLKPGETAGLRSIRPNSRAGNPAPARLSMLWLRI